MKPAPLSAAPGEVAPDARPALLDLSWSELERRLEAILERLGEPRYRLEQIRGWLYQRSPEDFAGMRDLPLGLREALAAAFVLHPLSLERELVSADGTRKFLWRRPGGEKIESVLIPDRRRVTYCVSSQAGCPVKCPFCATGHGGFRGQLGPAEILDQVVAMRARTGLAPTNVVFMGMGEPLLNFGALTAALATLTAPRGVGFASRRVTVSTVGIPDRLRELGRRFGQVHVALSLHAARDRLRDLLVPLNRQYPVRDVLRALRDHHRTTGRLPTVEYVLLPGVNDAPEQARALARLLEGLPCRVNLIGFNPFPGAPYRKPAVSELLRFRRWLTARYRGAVTLRRSRGEDIQGACGQLTLARD